MGSDLDVIVILDESDRPFIDRASGFDFTGLPVPADVLVYTRAEWNNLAQDAGRFYRTVREEAVWVYRRDQGGMTE